MTNDELKYAMQTIGRKAMDASRLLATSSTEERNRWLNAMADALEREEENLLAANRQDLTEAEANGLAASKLERLALNHKRVKGMADGLRQVAALEDPVGKVLSSVVRPNGLRIDKVSVPIGVIGIIFESRPNVTADAAGLCLKSGNAVILRGGSEAFRSNMAIAECLSTAGKAAGMPDAAVQLVPFKGHEAVSVMLKMDDCIQLVMPRGGEKLIRAVVEQATMPVIKHYKGVCHIFVDREADEERALAIIENAKCQRPSVCNALETILIHSEIAPRFVPALAAFLAERHVEMRGDEAFRALAKGFDVKAATEEDWSTEYLDLIVSIRIVKDVKEAVEHINRYGSGHSDSILTANEGDAVYFLDHVDSAAVYWNASTRFTDGGEFGMGAEMGISTDKIHARGPMGLTELTSYKYKIYGNGQIRP